MLALALATGPAAAQPPEPAPPPQAQPMAWGFTTDLLPPVVSAIAGDFGGSLQTWLGIGHARVRLVAARVSFPPALSGGDGFRARKLGVVAGLIDYVFGPRWSGFWVGGGVESWANRIEHRDAPGERASWQSAVATAGGGYIWPVLGNFYLEPWGAAHLLLDNPAVSLAGHTYHPFPVTAELSLKLGWFVDL
jgi:hypothetical protein